MKNRFLKKFSSYELIIIAFTAALGIAVKPFIVSLSHLITGPLLIPGGAFAGGFYMLFVILGAGLVKKPGTATLICIIQAILVTVTGVYGTHGIASFITYILPGFMVDFIWFLIGHRGCCKLCCFIGCIVANVSGVFLVNFVFFRLPMIPLLLSLSIAALSGAIGGLVAWSLIQSMNKYVKI